jgi:Flp pilus assembly protein TadG
LHRRDGGVFVARVLRKRQRSSTAAIEAALVLPLVVILVLSTIEYGWMFLQEYHITHVVRQGARVAIRIDATNAEVEAAIATLMERAGLADSGYTVTFSPADVASLSKGETLRIRISVPYANIGLGMPVPSPEFLRASSTMASEG